MKAAVHTRYGPPDVVRVVEVDKPAAKANEVLVKVHATTVNRTDCGYRAAKPFIVRFFTGLVRPRVTVLGNEFAGVVEAAGSGVTSRVIDYTVEDFTKDEQRYDAVGKRSFGRCRRLLKAGGFHGSTDLVRCRRTRSWRSSLRCSAVSGSSSRSRGMTRRWCGTSRG